MRHGDAYRRSWASWCSDTGILGLSCHSMDDVDRSLLLTMALLVAGLGLIALSRVERYRSIELTPHRHLALMIGLVIWLALNWIVWL